MVRAAAQDLETVELTLDHGVARVIVNRPAFEIAYLGERIARAQALEWGLVSRVVPDPELAQSVSTLAVRRVTGLRRGVLAFTQRRAAAFTGD